MQLLEKFVKILICNCLIIDFMAGRRGLGLWASKIGKIQVMTFWNATVFAMK